MDNFWSRAVYDPQSGCWLWSGYVAPNGYGKMGVAASKVEGVHRYAYERFVGKIPPGMQIDHLCRTKACCNPDHLEVVTPKENMRRIKRPPKKTHCPRGHPLSGDNVSIQRGRTSPRCRICSRELRKLWGARNVPARTPADDADRGDV